jgi:hypothetical protein
VKRASARTPSSRLHLGEIVGETEIGDARRCQSKTGAGTIGRTYRTSALPFRTANLEIWQARYTWVFFQFCVDSYEKLDRTRISNARGALDLRGTVGFFASEESVTVL